MRNRRSGPFVPLLVVLAWAGPCPLVSASEAKVWIGKEKDYERFLEKAEIVSVEDIGTGINQPKRVTLRQGAMELHAVWKPIQRGPKEWAWESFEAEVAAYQMDRVLGLQMVPPTVVRGIDGREGSLQLWLSGVDSFRDVEPTKPQPEEWEHELARMRLFDCLIGNGDRKPSDILVDEQKNLVLIDHSQAFLGSHYLDDDEQNLPQRFERRLVSKLDDLDLEYLRFRFGRLLLEPQITAVIMRRDGLMRRLDRLIAEKGEEAVLFGPSPKPR